MTPKQKAEDLVDRFYWTFGDGYLGDQHIQCALIAVDEVINFIKINTSQFGLIRDFKIEYWIEVKQEIEKL